MSLRPDPIGPIPAATARVARAAFPKGSAYLRLRDTLGPIYTNADFAALFPRRGHAAEAPWRLALVTVFQFAEGLSDRQAADAVRGRLDWKYALGLPLEDPGFHYSVLSEFRARLVAGGAAAKLLDALLDRCQAAGLVRARGRQRTDSTHVLAAARARNRVQLLGETVRAALNALAVAAPDWLRPHRRPEWTERYGPRVEEYRLPKDRTARQAVAETMGADGFAVLGAVYAPDAPDWLRGVPAVETLRRVWVQQFYAPAGRDAAADAPDVPHAPAPTPGATGDQPLGARLRPTAEAPAPAQLIHSPYDPEARYSTKRAFVWVGYKAHVTETCDARRPHLLTHVETAPATESDVAALTPIHRALATKALLPAQHLVDAGYPTADHLVTSRATYGVDLLGPVHATGSWQARAGQGFDLPAFTIDWDARTVTCPQGQTSQAWKPTHDRGGNPAIHVTFPRATCQVCPRRAACTQTATGPRELNLRPEAHHRALQAARQRQPTPAFQAQYAARAGVEGTLAQGVRRCGLRRARYRGLAKTHLQHLATAAAVNVARLDAWWTETPLAPTRHAAFARLLCPPASRRVVARGGEFANSVNSSGSQAASRSAGWPQTGAGSLQSSARAQTMSSAAAGAQRAPGRLRRTWSTLWQPPSTTPLPTGRPSARRAA
jgi:transposase